MRRRLGGAIELSLTEAAQRAIDIGIIYITLIYTRQTYKTAPAEFFVITLYTVDYNEDSMQLRQLFFSPEFNSILTTMAIQPTAIQCGSNILILHFSKFDHCHWKYYNNQT